MLRVDGVEPTRPLSPRSDWDDFREFNPLPSWVPFPVAKFAVKRLAALTKAWYAWERKRGGGGTCEGNAPLYASVQRLLAEQKK